MAIKILWIIFYSLLAVLIFLVIDAAIRESRVEEEKAKQAERDNVIGASKRLENNSQSHEEVNKKKKND